MPPLVFKSNQSPDVEAEKEAKRQRLAEIKAMFAQGDIEGGNAAMAAYQAERAEQIRNRESERR